MSPRRKANRARPSEVASHPNADPNDSEVQHHPNEGRSDERPHRRLLTVLFCERELQKTLDLDASISISEAKKIGSRELLDYLRHQPDAPPDLSIDDECTDFFPVPSNDTLTIGDLAQHTAVMILWPKGLPGTNLTPSPYMDELKHRSNKVKLQAAELNEARSKLNMYQLLEEEKPGPQTKQLGKTQKPGGSVPITPVPHDVIDEDGPLIMSILQRLTALEESNTELRESNTELRESNMELRESNMELRESNMELRENSDRLEATMQTTMEAVIGDRIAINKIRNRVLLDLARNQLAVICGYDDWCDWKSHAKKETMLNSASIRLQNGGNNITDQWKALHSRPTALSMLIFPNPVRSRGDLAAHASAQKFIGESVLGLAKVNEREDMCAIFAAVFGEEPAIDT